MSTSDERDRWLQQALRHAPDADAAPSSALREAILAQARAQAPRAGRRGRPWIASCLAWLARPPVAAAFATLAVSTVLTSLWWSGSLDEGADPRVAEFETTTVTAPAGDAASATAARAASVAVVPPAAAPAPPQPAQKAEARQGRSAPGSVAPAHPPLGDANRRSTAAPQPGASAPAAPAALEPQRAPAPQDPRLHRATPAEALAGASAERRRLADSGPDPLDAVAATIAQRADTLRWGAAGRTHAHAAPQQAWFAVLREATAGRWRPTRTDDRDGAPVQLFDGPRVRAEWLVQPDRVIWLDAASGTWEAPLARSDSARLRALADAW